MRTNPRISSCDSKSIPAGHEELGQTHLVLNSEVGFRGIYGLRLRDERVWDTLHTFGHMAPY